MPEVVDKVRASSAPRWSSALFEPFRRLEAAAPAPTAAPASASSIVRSVAAVDGGHATARALEGGGQEVTVGTARAGQV